MALEEAISWAAEVLSEVKWLPHSRKSIEMLVAHAEATHWRKLSEEKPTKTGRYMVKTEYLDQDGDTISRYSDLFWNADTDNIEWRAHGVTHWSKVVGPEDG